MRGDFSRVTFDPGRRYRRVLLQQGRVLLDADFNEQMAILLEQQRLFAHHVIGDHGGPTADLGFALTDLKAAAGDFAIGPGSYYVRGVLCENVPQESGTLLRYQDQPGIGASGSHVDEFDAAAAYIVYLDVHEREISSLEDEALRETALGGPDTCWRSRFEWLVKVRLKDDDVAVSTARMRAGLRPSATSDTPCVLPPDSRFQGVENQLYRVEIQSGGGGGDAPVFKWSRDNGSVTFAIKPPAGTTVQLVGALPDARFQPAKGCLVELIDDGRAASGMPGELIAVNEFSPADMTVVLASAPTALDPDGHPRLIRWEGTGEVTESRDPASGTIALEGGIEIQFEPPDAGEDPRVYVPGDYWLIPARTIGGTIEWPDGVFRSTLARRYSADIGTIGVGGLKDNLRKKMKVIAP